MLQAESAACTQSLLCVRQNAAVAKRSKAKRSMWILGTKPSDQSAKGRPPHYSATEPFYQPSLMARLPRHLRGAKAIRQELRACCSNSGRLKLHPAPLQEDLLGKLAGATTLSNQRSLASWFAQSQHQRHQIPQLLHTPPTRTCPFCMDSCHRSGRAF